MEIEVVYSDDRLLAINKPPGISVHSAPGPGASLLKELGSRFGKQDLAPLHRIDKDASGVLLLARDKDTAKQVSKVWPSVQKTYEILCDGILTADCGLIDAPILENQTGKPERLRVAVEYFKKQNPNVALPPPPRPKTSAVHPAGRASQTEYRVLERFKLPDVQLSWLEVKPRQGRMHQIRVHCANIGHPLAVDPVYGKRGELTIGGQTLLTRLPLHASSLTIPSLDAPGECITIAAPLSADIQQTLAALRSASR